MEQDIVIKIKKLLALSESDNKHEAESAMLKAQELLAKHNLQLDQIKEFEEQSVKKDATDITFTKAKWKGRLAKVIAANFKCEMYCMTYRVHQITFLGLEQDVAICKMMTEYAIEIIKQEVRKIARAYRNKGHSTKGIESDFALGFIDGLSKKFEEQKAKNKEWGLVLVIPKEVQDMYNDIKFTRKGVKPPQYKGHRDVYFDGVEAGENFNINRLKDDGQEQMQLIG
ncbi:MAG: DUF2786 domain-containing protein [Cellulosilyticaceae bacterium]